MRLMPHLRVRKVRPVRKALLVATALLANGAFAALPAAASDMPFYDPGAYCRQVANAVGGSEVIRGACFNNEQAAYDGLKVRWPGISRQTRLHCNQVSRASAGLT